MKLQIKDDAGKVTKVSIANRDEITIGRKEGNTIRLTEKNVSRSHARFLKKGDEVHVEDLSRYGTRVNGDRIRVARRVADGDIIQIGDYELSFEGVKPFDKPGADNAAGASGAAAAAEAPKKSPADAKKQKEIEAAARAQIAAAKAESEGPPKVESTVSIQAVQDDGDRKSLGGGKKRIGAVHPTLVAVTSDIAGKEYPLTSKTMILGRTGENDIVIEHHSISRNHAKIVIDDGAVKMVDLQSKNGIRVNGELWEESVLKSGDVVELGKVQFRFVEKGEEFIFRPEDWREGGLGQAAVLGEPEKKKSKAWMFILLLLVAGGIAAVFVFTQKPPVADNTGAIAGTPPGGATPTPVKPVEPAPAAVAAVTPPPEAKPPEVAPTPAEVKPVEPAPVDSAAAIKDAMDKARAAVGAQNWEEALKHLEVVVVLDKANEDARRLKETILREQKIGEGFAQAQTAQGNKDLEAAWMALQDLGAVPETSVYYARVTELRNAVGPAIANARVEEAKGLLAKKQYPEAIAKGEEALALVAEHAGAKDVIAKARKARAAEQRADDRKPPATTTTTKPPQPSGKSAQELYQEARTFHASDPAKALSLYKQAADKGYAAGWKQIGSIKAKQGDRAAAIAAYEKYLKFAPNAADANMVREVLNQWKGN